MAVHDCKDLHRAFTTAFNAHDLDALIALYGPDAVLAPQPGQLVTGHAAIRAALAQFLSMRPTISLQTRQITEAAGVALLRSSWTLRGTGPDGQGMEMSGNGIEVGIRRPDGNWVFVIDQPFGAD